MTAAFGRLLVFTLVAFLAGCTTGGQTGPVVNARITPQTADRAHDVAFAATLTNAGPASGWLWTFGDGAAATTQNATHRYASLGTYRPTLNVTLNGKQVAVALATVVVENLPPKASGRLDGTTAHRNVPVQFTDASADADGSIKSWSWDFGVGDSNNGVSHEQDPAFTYRSLGHYTPKLTVTDNDGAQSNVTLPTVTVENRLPTASFDFSPDSPGAGEPISFNDKSVDSDGSISAWTWDFGDGGSSAAQQPTHTYSQSGEYSVRLTVRDNDGGQSSTFQPVFVAGATLSISNFQYTDEACDDDVPFSFTLSNTSSVTATNVGISVTGGYQDYSNTIASVAPVQSGTVSGDVRATDHCGSSDPYTLTVQASPSNGSTARYRYTITI